MRKQSSVLGWILLQISKHPLLLLHLPLSLSPRLSQVGWQFGPTSQDIWQYLEIFLVVTARARHRHLMGRGQGCCSTSYNAQSSPQQQKQWAISNVTGVQAKASSPKSTATTVTKTKCCSQGEEQKGTVESHFSGSKDPQESRWTRWCRWQHACYFSLSWSRCLLVYPGLTWFDLPLGLKVSSAFLKKMLFITTSSYCLKLASSLSVFL